MKKKITTILLFVIVLVSCKSSKSDKPKEKIDVTGYWTGHYSLADNANSSADSDWTIKFNTDGTCKAYDSNIKDTSNCMIYMGNYIINDSIISITANSIDNSGYQYVYKVPITNNSINGELVLQNLLKSKPVVLKGKATLVKL
jgi:hypothetical protein